MIMLGVLAASQDAAPSGAVTLVGSATSSGITGTGTFAFNHPAGVAGDVLVIMSFQRNGSTAHTVTASGLTFTGRLSDTDGAAGSIAVHTAVLPDSTVRSVTVAGGGGASTSILAGAAVFRGADNSAPIDVMNTVTDFVNTTTPYTFTVPAATTVADGAMAVAFVGSNDDNAITTPGSPWASLFALTAGTTYGSGGAAAYQSVTTAGTTGTAAFQLTTLATGTDDQVGVIFALKPA